MKIGVVAMINALLLQNLEFALGSEIKREEFDGDGIALWYIEDNPNNTKAEDGDQSMFLSGEEDEELFGDEETSGQRGLLESLVNNPRMLTSSGAYQYSGVWSSVAPESKFISYATRSTFISLWNTYSSQGYRLVDLDIIRDGVGRRYAGVFHKKTGSYALWMGFTWANFVAKWNDEHSKGRRLIDVEVYTVNGVAYYDGVFIGGSYGQRMWKGTKASFINKWSSWSSSGWRLVDLETFIEKGVRYYVGVFKPGSGSYGLWMEASWSSFVSKWKQWTQSGMRLIDFDQYRMGSSWRYLGVFRQGNGGHYLWVGADYENFKSKDYQLKQMGLHLTDISFNDGYGKCSVSCANDVIGTPYNYKLTGHSTWYRWPIIEDGSSKYIRHSALDFANPNFYLPYSDTDVKLTSGWQYSNNKYHYALDMSKGNPTFALKAVTSGRIIHVGWDNWSGNSVVLESASGEWRIIYMHVRNGKTNDCDKAWDETMPTLNGDNEDDYEAYLINSGCEDNNRNPQELYWGTNSQTIPVEVGDWVTRGTTVAWTGNTGPGGKRGASLSVNTHLHIFFTRKDPTDGRWYFIDPYGIYSTTSCYPSKLGPLNTPCARYPRAWKLDGSGKLMYA